MTSNMVGETLRAEDLVRWMTVVPLGSPDGARWTLTSVGCEFPGSSYYRLVGYDSCGVVVDELIYRGDRFRVLVDPQGVV